MEVRHLLVAVFTLVGQNSATAFHHAERFYNFPNGTHKASQLRIASILAKIGVRNIRSFWNYENMNGRLRIDVFKRQCIVILVNLFTGNLATQNFGENIFIIINQSPNPFALNFFP